MAAGRLDQVGVALIGFDVGDQFGRSGQTSGEITKLNHMDGTLTVSIDGDTDMKLRAHPRELETLSQGQTVDVTFYRTGRHDWVQSIRATDEGM